MILNLLWRYPKTIFAVFFLLIFVLIFCEHKSRCDNADYEVVQSIGPCDKHSICKVRSENKIGFAVFPMVGEKSFIFDSTDGILGTNCGAKK